MNSNIKHILLFAFISGVIGLSTVKDGSGAGLIINGENVTDVPSLSTVPAVNPITTTTAEPPNTTTEIPTTTVTPKTTTKASTTTTAPNTTTTVKPTTTTSTTTQTPTTAPSNITTSTTESTTPAPTPAPGHKGRRFDGPSFIGGIILASGLMAIGFVSWKFYKARTERNYHTL